MGDVGPDGRAKAIKRWMSQGGVLLISDRTFSAIKQDLQPDVLVLDEAHTMVRNSSTKIYKALNNILTPRRIGKNRAAMGNIFLYSISHIIFRRFNWLSVSK